MGDPLPSVHSCARHDDACRHHNCPFSTGGLFRLLLYLIPPLRSWNDVCWILFCRSSHNWLGTIQRRSYREPALPWPWQECSQGLSAYHCLVLHHLLCSAGASVCRFG